MVHNEYLTYQVILSRTQVGEKLVETWQVRGTRDVAALRHLRGISEKCTLFFMQLNLVHRTWLFCSREISLGPPEEADDGIDDGGAADVEDAIAVRGEDAVEGISDDGEEEEFDVGLVVAGGPVQHLDVALRTHSSVNSE